MQRKRKLLALLAAAVFMALPAAVLLAQSPESGQAGSVYEDGLNQGSEIATTDPNPATDPVQAYQNLQRADAEGNSAAVREAAEEMREEILSRLPPEEREAALNAPQEPDVPADTLAYIPPSMPQEAVEQCKASLEKEPDPLCELIVLHDEGKIRSGAFSASEVDAALKGEQE